MVFLFLIFIKLFLFWLWLWQLMEYHFGRFLAHFETRAFRKIIASIWWFKYPKFTKKIAVIFLTGLVLDIIMLAKGFWPYTPFLIIFVPLIFQIPTIVWRKRFLKKARLKRESFKNLLVIGITGSYGKTTTKEFLYTILVSKFGERKILKTKEHQNSEVGISQCILNDLNREHEIFVCEMGAYNRGGIKLLCGIAKPKIGILTGINEQHLATFGSQENVIKAKYELIESLPQDGIAFFNAQNKYCVELYNKINIKKVLYGQAASFRGEENILGAKAVAKELGMSDVEIQDAVSKIENKMPGVRIREGINGLKIIDATYSANPTGVIAHLEYLKTLSGPPAGEAGKKVLVMPCLIELGAASKEVHCRIGQKIAEVCDLAIITTGDRFKEIKAAFAEASASQEAEIIFMENPKEIFEKIKSTTQSGDVVLLESRVPRELIRLLSE